MKLKLDFLYRKKAIETIKMQDSKLSRVLNVFDLTTLGKNAVFKFTINKLS